MANIKPFRAWRYREEKAGKAETLFSPLLDVVDTEQLAELYQKEYNSIHLSVPRSHESVVRKLKEWKYENIIKQEALPSIYVYYQTFQLPTENQSYTRKGFVSMIEMCENDILLHEDTITHSVESRIHLLEQTMLNIIPTHGLYEDTQFQLEKIMDEYMQTPLYQYEDVHGIVTKLAIIQNPKDILAFIRVLKNKQIYLADGHHRLESSRIFRDKYLMENGLADSSFINYHLMYLTNLAADDLRILPTHRIWQPKENISLADVLSRMFPYWKVTDVSDYPQPLSMLMQNKKYAFGLIHKRKEYLIEIRLGLQTNIPLEMPEVWKQLSYTVLHYYFFEKAAYIPYHQQSQSEELRYEKSYSTAAEAGRDGAFTFICQEVTMQEIVEVCQSGCKMPQKSTYFYPKVVCGLLFGSIKDEENNSAFDSWFTVAEKKAIAR
ncbi:MAG: DUF1015 family protein [Bacteroidia bacterium]